MYEIFETKKVLKMELGKVDQKYFDIKLPYFLPVVFTFLKNFVYMLLLPLDVHTISRIISSLFFRPFSMVEIAFVKY